MANTDMVKALIRGIVDEALEGLRQEVASLRGEVQAIKDLERRMTDAVEAQRIVERSLVEDIGKIAAEVDQKFSKLQSEIEDIKDVKHQVAQVVEAQKIVEQSLLEDLSKIAAEVEQKFSTIESRFVRAMRRVVKEVEGLHSKLLEVREFELPALREEMAGTLQAAGLTPKEGVVVSVGEYIRDTAAKLEETEQQIALLRESVMQLLEKMEEIEGRLSAMTPVTMEEEPVLPETEEEVEMPEFEEEVEEEEVEIFGEEIGEEAIPEAGEITEEVRKGVEEPEVAMTEEEVEKEEEATEAERDLVQKVKRMLIIE